MDRSARATRTLTALYEDHGAAERAVERLSAAGVSESCIAMRRASDFEVSARKHGRTKLAAGLAEFLMPEPDRRSYADGLARGGTLVVASDVPADLEDRALDILDAEAIDLEDVTPDPDDPDHEGAIGTLGGFGVATGDVDRLTGQRLGPAEPPNAEAAEAAGDRDVGGTGAATGSSGGVADMGTGTGAPRSGKRLSSPRHRRARRYGRDDA